jgi:hypothetical protein
MSFRREGNRREVWIALVRTHASLLAALPREAVSNEDRFREYLTPSTCDGARVSPSVFELSSDALEALVRFVDREAAFDMDTLRFDDLDQALR